MRIKLTATARADLDAIAVYQRVHNGLARAQEVTRFLNDTWPTIPRFVPLAAQMSDHPEVKKVIIRLRTVRFTVYFRLDDNALYITNVVPQGANIPLGLIE
jgi:plasmid stabilization system protein ParE